MKRRKKLHILNYLILCTLLFQVFIISAYSRGGGNGNTTGTISGYVIDKKTGETLVGASILIDGTIKGTVSGFDGHFEISGVQPGTYDLKITFVSYTPTILEKIKVEPVKNTQLNVELESSSVNLSDVTITAVRRTNTEISMISSIKAAPLVVTGISNQQIQKSQDKDASEVVKRLPGVTIMDDRFIVVRGLNQRYNSVWINNAATPSSETDVKAFSFDVIPSGMIDNLKIYKSGAPELPADFVGGFINVATKNMPDNNYLSMELGTSYNTNTTFKDFQYYKGGSSDFLGFDDGTRALPSDFPSDLSTISDADALNHYAKEMPNNWAVYTKTAKPDIKGSINYGQRFKIKKIQTGTITSLTYTNSDETQNIENNSYVNGGYLYNDKAYKNNTKISLLHNWSFFLGNGNKIELRNLFNQIGFNKTTYRYGTDSESDLIKSYEERFMSRSMYSGQIGGEHNINEGNLKIEWNIGYSFANRLEPDRKVYMSKYVEAKDSFKAVLPTSANPKSCGHLYMKNIENIYSSGLGIEKKFNFTSFIPTLKAGFYSENKNREFNARNIGFAQGVNFDNEELLYLPMGKLFSEENLDYLTKIKLCEYTNKSDNYTATNALLAGYMGANLPFTKKINLYGGVRAEKNKLTLNSHSVGGSKVSYINDKLYYFPSANLSVNFTEKTLVRLAYYKSINRPEFREIAPYVFYDYVESASITGNESLTDALIDNFDCRFEFYPDQSEIVSIALFYKNFSNPIEEIFQDGSSGLNYTFENAKKADNKGIELEVRKSLEFIGLNNFNVTFNGTVIKSNVHFDADYSRDRALQGQSPYVINAGLYYENPNKGLMLSALYNIVGKRIMITGIPKQNVMDDINDIYEQPRNLLDITFSKKLGKHLELKGGVKNLLNEPVLYNQKVHYETTGYETDVIKKYKTGSNYSLSLTYKF